MKIKIALIIILLAKLGFSQNINQSTLDQYVLKYKCAAQFGESILIGIQTLNILETRIWTSADLHCLYIRYFDTRVIHIHRSLT